MKKNILIVMMLGVLVTVASADYVSWMDKKFVNHENNIVSVSTADSMMISKTKEFGQVKPTKTRVRIRQNNPCLCLTEGWEKGDYAVVSHDTVILDAFTPSMRGATLAFDGDYTKCVKYLLGKKGCSLVGSKEYWDVEQKIDGAWKSVAKGHFTFVK